MITKEYAEELVQITAEKNEEPSFLQADESELLDENISDPITSEIPGLEGTLQTADDV